MLIYAVFDSDEPQGERLRPTDFDTNQIKRGELSLARRGLTDWPTFRDRVVVPKGGAKALKGIVSSNCEAIRRITKDVQGFHPKKILRGVCIIDKAIVIDFVGHATLKFCEDHNPLTAKQKTSLRSRITADLADAFGVLMPIVACYPEAATKHF
jgi:hypothetical protein